MKPISQKRKSEWQINEENYEYTYLRFQDRQAGVNLVFDSFENRFFYNAYCVEVKLLNELFSVEYRYLEDALETINDEFGTWEVGVFDAKKKECGSCVAKS